MKKHLLIALTLLVIASVSQLNSYAQGVYTICSPNSNNSTSDSTGTLYDTGGPNDIYQVNENCTLLVAPSCAASITLSFQQFATEPGFDFFHVYDGATVTATNEVLVADGTTIPGPVTCFSGYMLIVWHSDVSITDSGFACTWTSVINPSIAPNAAFSIGNLNPPIGVGVPFTDQTTGGTTGWLWYFGDGDTAHSQNPTHVYNQSGPFTVTLIAFQCSESDTITHTINVQAPPQIQVTPPAGFTASVACGDSAHFTMNVSNIAGGQLLFNTNGTNVGSIRVLAMTYGTNSFVEFPRTIAAINTYFTNYTLTTTGTVDPGVLSGQLIGKNVLLIPEQSNGGGNVWANLGPVIRQYLTNGGSVVFCGSASSFSDDLYATGVFTGSYAEDETGLSLNVLNTTDPLTTGLTTTSFVAPSACYSQHITNTDKVTLVDFQTNDVVTYRYYGTGKAIYVGFDYYASSPETQRIIANAIEWGGINALPPWIHLSITGDTVNAGGTSPVGVTFVASGFPAGTYYANIGVGSNDPNNPLVVVPCTLTVSGFPIINLSNNCIAVGQVMQHTTVSDTFKIINNGCDTLKISNLSTGTASFIVNAGFSYLLPGAFGDVVVTFNGNTVGSFVDTVHILNNDVDTFVCLTATTFPAPVVSPSTNSITQNIRACNVSGTTTFNLTNTGGSDLIYHIGNLPSWISIVPNPASDTLAPNASITFTLNFNSGSFAGGPQPANIQIISNDPLAPNKLVAFTMQVDSNPCMDYTFTSNTCTGFSVFTSTAINTPTSYHWDFGDGGTSTDVNPVHPYSHNGTYTVVLIACNAHGCDTVTNTVNAIITGPKPAICYDSTMAYCCNIGIILFQVTDPFGFKFNKSSPDAVDGYKDYTCTDNATLLTNFSYNLNVTTGPIYPERFKAWLDMNNDGILDSVSELLYIDSALINHAGTFTIPALPTNVYNEPLRFRIASDYIGNPDFNSCLKLSFGQAEDYSVFLQFYDDVSELSRETAFHVYPNPFNQFANIEYSLNNSSNVSVEVYDIVGKKVKSLATTEMQYPGKHSYQFGGEPSGIYFVKLTVDDKSTIQKIIKM